jgi:hypothetical protein
MCGAGACRLLAPFFDVFASFHRDEGRVDENPLEYFVDKAATIRRCSCVVCNVVRLLGLSSFVRRLSLS